MLKVGIVRGKMSGEAPRWGLSEASYLREWIQTSLLEIPNHKYFSVNVRNTESYNGTNMEQTWNKMEQQWNKKITKMEQNWNTN